MYPLTLQELQERLKRLDELSLLELLDITSEEIVEFFVDRIEDNFDRLMNEVDYDGEDDEEDE
jgi:hypothetical protein